MKDDQLAGSVSAFRDEHQALLAELAQVRKERDEARADAIHGWSEVEHQKAHKDEYASMLTALEAARDHLRARLRALQAYAQHLDECAARFTDNPRVDGVRDVCTCGFSYLLAILSEPEEAQQTEQQEPDHARMDTKADAER